MSSPSFPGDYYTTVESFETLFEGEDFLPYYPEKSHFECDFCSKGVPYEKGPRVGQYLTDRLPYATSETAREINQRRILTPLATYCEDCTYRKLLFPCEGYTEVRVLISLDESRVIKHPRITDISSCDDGIPWKPAELAQKITQVPHEDLTWLAGDDVLMGPENIVTFFLSLNSGIDIRELVRWDGSLDSKLLGQARRRYREFANEMRRSGWNKRHYRRSVRDD